MKVLLTSPLGPPDDPRTWSHAPAHIAAALRDQGAEVIGYDSSSYGKGYRAIQGTLNALRGYPWNAVAWFAASRRRRAAEVAAQAKRQGVDMVLCTSTLDAPLGHGVAYGIWIDNSWNLLENSEASLNFPAKASAKVDALERQALQGAACVLTFSEHLRDNITGHYGVPAQRVSAVGCGAGDLPPFEGQKRFADGHLLFVAKHLFQQKGGALLLSAFPRIRAARPQTKLILVGNDEARTAASGIEGVETHGFVERETLNGFFHDAAMLVQPMRSDPWGQVYIEAMKARAVVVSCNVAAVPELTREGREGAMIDALTPEALAEAVLGVYARPQEDLDAMTRAAQARVLRDLSWEAVGARVLAALRAAPVPVPAAVPA